MHTITSSRRPADQRNRRASRLGSLLLGVIVGALAAIGGGVLLFLLGQSTSGWLAAALMLLSVGAGGWIAARRLAEVGWKHGLYVGLLLAVLTLIVTLISGENLDIAGIVTVCLGCSMAGAAGGWLARRIAQGRSQI